MCETYFLNVDRQRYKKNPTKYFLKTNNHKHVKLLGLSFISLGTTFVDIINKQNACLFIDSNTSHKILLLEF